MKNVLGVARKYGVPANLVQTGHISLEERYRDEVATRKPRVFLGYAVTKQIAIVLRDVSNAEALLADIFKSGITRIEDVKFRTTQVRKYKDQARALAIKPRRKRPMRSPVRSGKQLARLTPSPRSGTATTAL